MCLENVDHHHTILLDYKMHLIHKARVGERMCLLKPKPLQPAVHNGCSPPQIKKQPLCLLEKDIPNTDNSITSWPPRFRSTALSFLARWAKRKLSYWLQYIYKSGAFQLISLTIFSNEKAPIFLTTPFSLIYPCLLQIIE